MVDVLLRSGADETILDENCREVADVVADYVEEEDRKAGDVERVYMLLSNAPADRAWRRRGYLVLCRAHPDRVQQAHESSDAHAGRVRKSCSVARTGVSGCIDAAAGSTLNERASDDWVGAVACVLRLQEEGIFRAIVGYL